mmetsp:Transcript_15850/g.35271  ORF Transcript_15850/g.35271 Transcript_15850/m.35271 type:complete len:112 (+) Transcript_15850:248-583(+)
MSADSIARWVGFVVGAVASEDDAPSTAAAAAPPPSSSGIIAGPAAAAAAAGTTGAAAASAMMLQYSSISTFNSTLEYLGIPTLALEREIEMYGTLAANGMQRVGKVLHQVY